MKRGFENKRALAPVIAYVLLIVVGVALALVVYAFLRQFGDTPDVVGCTEAVDINIKNYSCVEGKVLCLNLENKGLFDADGFVLRIDNTTKRTGNPYVIDEDGFELNASQTKSKDYFFPKDYYSNGAVVGKIDSVRHAEIQAYQEIDGKKQLCPNVITKEISCKPYGHDCSGNYYSGESIVSFFVEKAGSGGKGRKPIISEWDGSSWNNEDISIIFSEVTGEDEVIKQLDIEYDPVRFDRYIAVAQDYRGKLSVLMRDGGNLNYCKNLFDAKDMDDVKVFDVAFEEFSGKGVIVFSREGDGALFYSKWSSGNCENWSEPQIIDSGENYNFVSLDSCPSCSGSRKDEIAGISIGEGGIVKSFVISGENKFVSDNLNQGTITTLQKKVGSVAVSYEKDSRDVLFTWGENQPRRIGYIFWKGSSFSSSNYYDLSQQPGWQILRSSPISDSKMLLLVAGSSSSPKLFTLFWNGDNFDSSLEEHASLINTNYFSADFSFEPDSEEGLLIWGDNFAGIVKSKTFDGSSFQGTLSTPVPSSSKHLWFSLISVPNWMDGNNKILGFSSDQNNQNLYFYTFNGAFLNYEGTISNNIGGSDSAKFFYVSKKPDEQSLIN